MRRFAGFTALFLLFAFSPVMGLAKTAVAKQQEPPVIRAVLFRADWCANCRILEPILEKAMQQAADIPVELITLDFTNAADWDQSVEIALDHNVVKTYNAYAGITGLVVLTSADTGERIDCINRTFTASAMVHTMKQAVTAAQSLPQGHRDRNSAFCPPGRAPLN
ncbi:MAG: thioredoxin family protein [Robiginitomaculum sp.]|nr:thioredoxin family protein [Robiginitomaculum sp.]MDQ7077331.1 thioredoxin family protein [Robiginitomaculum sp.]